MRSAVLAIVLLALPALAWNLGNPNLNASSVPSRYFRAELLQGGFASPFGVQAGILQLDYLDGRFRGGAKLLDFWQIGIFITPAPQIALVHVGLTIVSLPVAIGESHWARPLDVYIQGKVAIVNALSRDPNGRGPVAGLELCADADYVAGIGLFGGVMAFEQSRQDWDIRSYVGLRFRLGVTAAALNEPGEAAEGPPGIF